LDYLHRRLSMTLSPLERAIAALEAAGLASVVVHGRSASCAGPGTFQRRPGASTGSPRHRPERRELDPRTTRQYAVLVNDPPITSPRLYGERRKSCKAAGNDNPRLRLENRCSGNPATEGSNPSPSASAVLSLQSAVFVEGGWRGRGQLESAVGGRIRRSCSPFLPYGV
jgi:hypothetical protein